MKCPIDGATLVISDRSGVEIDYCPECRGVWLDRGELEKLLSALLVRRHHHLHRVRCAEGTMTTAPRKSAKAS